MVLAQNSTRISKIKWNLTSRHVQRVPGLNRSQSEPVKLWRFLLALFLPLPGPPEQKEGNSFALRFPRSPCLLKGVEDLEVAGLGWRDVWSECGAELKSSEPGHVALSVSLRDRPARNMVQGNRIQRPREFRAS